MLLSCVSLSPWVRAQRIHLSRHERILFALTVYSHTSSEGAGLVVDPAEFGGVIPCFQFLDGTCGVVETKHRVKGPVTMYADVVSCRASCSSSKATLITMRAAAKLISSQCTPFSYGVDPDCQTNRDAGSPMHQAPHFQAAVVASHAQQWLLNGGGWARGSAI